MQRLIVGEHVHLTDTIMKVLAQNRITTILDFLQEDTEKLSNLTKLSLPQLLDIRNYILNKYSAPLVNGTSLLTQYVTRKKYISTGIENIDAVLGGGITIGTITEICGLPDSGKTQLCMQLSINCVKNSDRNVLYVDTKGDFSATRVQKILDACAYSCKEMAHIMFKIKIIHIWTMDEILQLFKKLQNKNLVIKELCLIIIDSLPCLMFQYLGDDNKVGLNFLNTLVNYGRCLCKELEIGIICVNTQTRWIDQDIFDADDCEQSTSKESSTEKRNRCLGRYWQYIPAFVLTLEKIQDQEKFIECNKVPINVTVVKSSNVQHTQNCVVQISNLGVG